MSRAMTSTPNLRVGERWSMVLVENLTRTQIVMYAGASGDFAAVHHDEVYARHAGFPAVFAHGMLTMGMTARAVTDRIGDGRLLRYGARMTAQVWPGDTLTATVEVTSVHEENGSPVVDLAITTVNQDGVAVLEAEATARLDAA